MNFMRRLTNQKRNFYLGASMLVVALSACLLGGASQQASAQDFDNNAIIYGGMGGAGATDIAEHFIAQVKANDNKNGQHDLQTIYSAYNLVPSQYDKFITSARLGTAYKDGRIVVDGQTVATNSYSIGRLASYQGAGVTSRTIGGVTYYGNYSTKVFVADSIPVMVMFNSQGVMQFAVLTSCGNPITGSNVIPSYGCTALKKTPIAGRANTYNFQGSATASGNAAILRYTYNFGDGSPEVVEPYGSGPVQHTYTKPGTWKATVTVTFSLPGSQNATATSIPCAQIIVVPPPPTPFQSCVQLTGAFIDKATYNYSFKAIASFGNGSTFTSADFNFGDKNSTNGVKPVGTVASTTHKYATAGNYRITATLHFNANGIAKSVTCTASVTPTQPPTPECKPGVPEGSALCTNCQYNSSLPSNSPQCTPPVAVTSLPNTGAGDVIAIFGAVVVAGFIIFRQFIYRKRRVATNDAAALSLGHHMVNGAQKEDQSGEMIQHLTQADGHATTAAHPHPNAAKGLHHPTYHRSNRFRPGGKHDK